MKLKLYSLILGLTTLIVAISTSYSHTDHYKNFKKIEMDIYKDGKIIGFSNYEFSSNSNELFVKNITEFKVKVLGVKVFSVFSNSEELYKNGNLIYFKSNTVQNNKKKYVNLKYEEDNNEFLIDGSSYKGKAQKNTIIGNWWNHDILKAKKLNKIAMIFGFQNSAPINNDIYLSSGCINGVILFLQKSSYFKKIKSLS